MDTPHTTNQPNPDAERLSDILSRIEEKFVTNPNDPVPVKQESPATPQTDDQPNLPLAIPTTALPMPPEYIRSEAFLEISGFFTPASKRIENIYIKEKKLREYTDDHGNKKILKTTIRASHGLGLPITSDLDYYRAFLKFCDEIVDRDGRFHMPVAVQSFRFARYAGKQWSDKTQNEIREWMKR